MRSIRWSLVASAVGIAALALAGCGETLASSGDGGGYEYGGAGGYYYPGEGNYAGSGGTGGVGSDSGNQFEDYGENPWVETADDHLATFAVDVDTGSYTIMRQYLGAGALPPSASVRAEEYINYFDYSYEPPAADSTEAVAIHLEAAPSFDDNVWLLRVGLKARELPVLERGPANLVFLIDVSGSMASENKLPLVKRSLELLLQELRPDDTVGIVTYAGTSEVALEPTPVSERETIATTIANLVASGSTHGSEGIVTAYAMAEEHFREGGINRVVLCSDGDFNVGLTDEALIEMIETMRDRGITLTVLGFGFGNFNDQDMEALADHGNGNYAYIDSEEEARRLMVERLLSTLSLVAKDAKVQLAFDPAAVLRYRLVGYVNRAVADPGYVDDEVDGGEMGSGHEVTALLELQLQEGATAESVLVDAGVRYQPPEGGTSTEVKRLLTVGEIRSDLGEATDDTRFATAVARFARILKQGGKAERTEFDEVIELAAGALGPLPPDDRREFVELVGRAKAIWPY